MLLAVLAGAGAGAVCWAQYRRGAQHESGAPEWLRSGQPPADAATYALPPAWTAVAPVRARSWPGTWAPMTGGDFPAWTWAGADEVEAAG